MTIETELKSNQSDQQVYACFLRGAFWDSYEEDPPDPRRMTAFSGKVLFNQDEYTFKGTMNDEYGLSDIEGRIDKAGYILEFTKTYTSRHPQS